MYYASIKIGKAMLLIIILLFSIKYNTVPVAPPGCSPVSVALLVSILIVLQTDSYM